MITYKSKFELNLMRTAGKIVAEVLAELTNMVNPGISTWELDNKAEKLILNNNAIPSFKGYHGYPATICSSINEEVVHGIPSKNRILREGDIISIDVGATYKGLVADSAVTVPVGEISEDKKLLLTATREALYESIKFCVTTNYLQDVSGVIEDTAKKYKLGLVRNYGGHGIGRKMHEDPFVYNFRTGEKGPKLKKSMTICLEPMFNLGYDDVYTLEDNWTVVTKDKRASAHFEHTIHITNGEPEIITIPDFI